MRTRRLQSSSDPVSSTPPDLREGMGHRTVLLHEALNSLDIQSSDIVVDATLGGAGHAAAIAGRLGKKGTLIGFDLDEDAIERARTALHETQPHTHFVQSNFRALSSEFHRLGISHADKVLFDLGWSGFQLAVGRGFSFLKDEPLLMTYEKNPGPGTLTARTIVNEWKEESIADILYGWGEERYSRRIAKAIVERRVQRSIETSEDLVEIIKRSVPPVYRFGRIHPATRSFQALRIAVNDELGAIKDGLRGALELLAPRGRIAVIAFHSIEDRLVKQTFADWVKDGKVNRITKKPIIPSAVEIKTNPRARSGKLRVIEKVPTLQSGVIEKIVSQ